MRVEFHTTPYFGLGIIIAPKTKQFKGHIVINVLVWEINLQWGKDEW